MDEQERACDLVEFLEQAFEDEEISDGEFVDCIFDDIPMIIKSLKRFYGLERNSSNEE